MGRASKGLLMGALFLGSLLAALPFFGARSTDPPGARQESTETNTRDPARVIVLRPVPQVPINIPKQLDDVMNRLRQNPEPAARVEVPPKAPVEAEAPAEAPARANVARRRVGLRRVSSASSHSTRATTARHTAL